MLQSCAYFNTEATVICLFTDTTIICFTDRTIMFIFVRLRQEEPGLIYAFPE